MYKTKHDLPEGNRKKLIELLNSRLADCIDLQSQAKQAHWNVKGPSFIALHELFDDVADGVEAHADLIAERAVQLGGVAEGTAMVIAQRSTLNEYPLTIADGKDHVEALSTAIAAFGKAVRRAVDQSAELQDTGTADLLTEVSRGIDKWLWFVEAHSQAGRYATKTITTDELKARCDKKGGLTLVNTLSAEAFEKTKIPGAINVPLESGDFAARVEQAAGGKDNPVVVYCASQQCDSSERAAKKLEAAGFTAVSRYTGGAAAWQKEAGEVHANQCR